MKKQTKIDKRRRNECKTNYKKRLILLKGNFPRLVIRKTNKYIILQVIESSQALDQVIYNANTKELLKSGWPIDRKGSLKSITASYLGGLLLGKRIKGLKKEIILDSGLIPNTSGSRVYAAVKGVADTGIKIKFNKDVFPSEEKIKGENTKVKDIFEKVKGEILK